MMAVMNLVKPVIMMCEGLCSCLLKEMNVCLYDGAHSTRRILWLELGVRNGNRKCPEFGNFSYEYLQCANRADNKCLDKYKFKIYVCYQDLFLGVGYLFLTVPTESMMIRSIHDRAMNRFSLQKRR